MDDDGRRRRADPAEADDHATGSTEEEIQRLTEDLGRRSPPPEPALAAKPRSSWRESWALAGVLLAAAAVLTAANVAGVGPFDRATASAPSSQEALDRARQTVLFGVEEIELYRAEHGSLPAHLEAVGLAEKGDFEYERRGDDGFRLAATVAGRRAVFDSERDDLGDLSERVVAAGPSARTGE